MRSKDKKISTCKIWRWRFNCLPEIVKLGQVGPCPRLGNPVVWLKKGFVKIEAKL